MEVGSTVEEAKQLRREHDELLAKLNVSNTAQRARRTTSLELRRTETNRHNTREIDR